MTATDPAATPAPTPPAHESRIGASGFCMIAGNMALALGGGATGNPWIATAGALGTLGCSLMVLDKLVFNRTPVLQKHSGTIQRVGFVICALGSACSIMGGLGAFMPPGSGDGAILALGALGMTGSLLAATKPEVPDHITPSKITDIRHVRSAGDLNTWWGTLPPTKAATLFYIPSGVSPISGLLVGATPALYQWATAGLYSFGNYLMARTRLPQSAPAAPTAPTAHL